jgi:enediyne polyketide synthase
VQTHTLAKVEGLRHILSAVRPSQLKLIIAFGSVIARSGYPYSAAYALANDCLAYQLSTYRLQHPHIRCQVLDWTVWSETGMGSTMHAIASLKKNGVDPLSNEAGRHAFLSVLGNSDASFRPIVAGRLPQTAAFLFAQQTPRIDGWADAEVTTFIPGVEIIAKVAISLEKLPWLAGHTSRDGILILPGTLAMKLMESVAIALSPGKPFDCFKDVRFLRLVRIPKATSFGICIQAIMHADGSILCCLTEDNSAHADPIASMLCIHTTERAHPVAAAKPATRLPEHAGRILADEMYEHLLFHRKAFQIINNYSFADATRAVFHIQSDTESSSVLQKTVTLHDAFLHGIQVCVPGELLLPVRIGTILRRRSTVFTSCTVDAREISFTPEAYYYQLAVYDEAGTMLEEWKDIEFRCYAENSSTASLPDSLASIIRQREHATEVRSSGYFEYRHTVGFKETNVAGNVYYTNHVEWQGRCREMFLKAHAPDVLPELESGQLALVTVSCSCEYEAELRAFDEVSVRMRMEALGNDWVTMSFEYWCAQSFTEVRIAKGLQKIAARRRTSTGLQPTLLPESMVIAFKAYGNDVS